MKIRQLICLFVLLMLASCSQEEKIFIQNDPDKGFTLMVDSEPFMINGMNWDYFPRGTNYEYSLWSQPDGLIKKALDNEMSLLKNMGVNAIRVYTGIPKKWIAYIYDNYQIYTMLNHSFGRYGLTIDGKWVSNTDYADPKAQALLINEVTDMAKEYKNTPGLLLFLLGNENNYGLFWEGAETEDIPMKDRNSSIRARAMYKLFNTAALAMKKADPTHPVAMCNGDLLFLDIIKKECKDIDIFGTNVYRGVSFGDAFEKVNTELNKPIMFTEFGADAYHDLKQQEDQKAQSYYLVGNWEEIYKNAAGLGLTNNSIGGFTFQFTDGWWKYGQTTNLSKHDNNASWGNGGYKHDHAEGRNNMNEEWFGICAKGEANDDGVYEVKPRAAYYDLQQAHKLNVYEDGMTVKAISQHFQEIKDSTAYIKAEK